MERVNYGKILAERRATIEALIAEYNTALKENDAAKLNRVEIELKEAEAAYAEDKLGEVFSELSVDPNPVKAAIIRHSYEVVGHSKVSEGGVLLSIEIEDHREKQIDLLRFCKFCKLKTDWQYTVEKFNQLLCLRTANELHMTKTQINKICDSFYMNRLSRAIELGETPDSNTAICKQLQKVCDEILFEDNGKGKNVYRVNNHDVSYLLMCYTRRGKKVLNVAVAKSAYVQRLVMDVLHRVLTDKTYDVEYKMVSDTQKAREAAKAKAEEEKAKKVSAKKATADGTEEVKVPKKAKKAKKVEVPEDETDEAMFGDTEEAEVSEIVTDPETEDAAE